MNGRKNNNSASRTSMKNFNRFNIFSSCRIKPYLSDDRVRKIARKSNKLLNNTEDQPIDETKALRGIHIFDLKLRDQSANAPTMGELRKERLETTQPPKDSSLKGRWAAAKIELAKDFEKNGNSKFIEEIKRVERSRRRKSKITKAARGGRSKVKAIRPTDACPATC